MPGKYQVESDSTFLYNPADDTSKDFDFSLPPGYYPSINFYAALGGARGAVSLHMRDPLTQKYRIFTKPQFSSYDHDRASWVMNNIQLDANNEFRITMMHTKAGDELLWGYYATREV